MFDDISVDAGLLCDTFVNNDDQRQAGAKMRCQNKFIYTPLQIQAVR